MLTAYDNYKQAHTCLFTATTHPDIHKASRDTVENYLENRRIWKELYHYKEKGVILGEHPIFCRMRRIEEIRQMGNAELFKFKVSRENNIFRNSKKLRLEPNHPQTLKRKESIQVMQQELSEVNRLLNFK